MLQGLFKKEDKIYPNDYLSLQDSKQSLTKDGKYDLRHFSKHEEHIISLVIHDSLKKYSENYIALGFANEFCQIIYKPRYILNEILIMLFKDSSDPYERFAVAWAYNTKGARFRKLSIEYFESTLDIIDKKIIDRFVSIGLFQTYLALAKMYESEHRYEEALKFNKKASSFVPRKGRFYYNQKDKELKEKIANPPTKRNRKVKEEDLLFDEDTKFAALYFIDKLGL